VVRNPFSRRYVEDLVQLIKPSGELCDAVAERAISLLGGRLVESYGKGVIAGANGEQEHTIACIITVFGDALREGVGGGQAWISSSTEVDSASEPLDIPLDYKTCCT
jgi:hypothetical protein